MCFSYRLPCLYFLCGTRKEICMEICEEVRFHHSGVKFMTLQEWHANNTQALMRDLNKICKQSQVLDTIVVLHLNVLLRWWWSLLLILSNLNYALPVWGPSLYSDLVSHLCHFHIQAVRVICGLRRYDDVSDCRFGLRWLPLH